MVYFSTLLTETLRAGRGPPRAPVRRETARIRAPDRLYRVVVPLVGHLRPFDFREESKQGRLQGPQTLVSFLPEELVVLRGCGVLDAGLDLGVTGLNSTTDGVKSSSTLRRNTYQDQAPPAQKAHTAGQDHPAIALLFIEVRDAS